MTHLSVGKGESHCKGVGGTLFVHMYNVADTVGYKHIVYMYLCFGAYPVTLYTQPIDMVWFCTV